jgi:hypothetical protein
MGKEVANKLKIKVESDRKGGENIQKNLKYTTYPKLIEHFKGRLKRRIELNSMMHGLMLIKDVGERFHNEHVF